MVCRRSRSGLVRMAASIASRAGAMYGRSPSAWMCTSTPAASASVTNCATAHRKMVAARGFGMSGVGLQHARRMALDGAVAEYLQHSAARPVRC